MGTGAGVSEVAEGFDGVGAQFGVGVGEERNKGGEDGGVFETTQRPDRFLLDGGFRALPQEFDEGEHEARTGDGEDGLAGDLGIRMVQQCEPGGMGAVGAEDPFETAGGGKDGPGVGFVGEGGLEDGEGFGVAGGVCFHAGG